MMVDVITLNLLLSGLILHAFCHEGVDSESITKPPSNPLILETIAKMPGCLRSVFIVSFGFSSLNQEAHTMFGPGEYRPDPSEGITTPAELPPPELIRYYRSDTRQPCPRCGH